MVEEVIRRNHEKTLTQERNKDDTIVYIIKRYGKTIHKTEDFKEAMKYYKKH